FYIGQTNNLDDRLFRHNSNQNLATKNKGPWQFIFTKQFTTILQTKKVIQLLY
ncbi:MAG: hypothetical protein RL708_1762, partial [Bacteroidota bacterium]